MRRRQRRARGSWAPAVLCLGLALLPLGVRQRAREALLDLHGALQTRLSGAPPEHLAADPTNHQVALLQAELLHLRRALQVANTAQQLVAEDASVRLIPAEVLPLAGAEEPLLHRVALARGRRDGVRPGMPVLAEGVLVGRVSQVAEATCEVHLVTDPAFRLRAAIPRPEGDVEGLLRGDGRRLYFEPALLDETRPAPEPRPGERVLCSRASVLCGLPALIGVVGAERRLPGATLQGADVTPARDLEGVRRVVIVQREERT
ncbi:MAG: rod shape-determining protein MreC [Planctomycetota bacterium]